MVQRVDLPSPSPSTPLRTAKLPMLAILLQYWHAAAVAAAAAAAAVVLLAVAALLVAEPQACGS